MTPHLLAFALIVALPVWDRFETHRLKTSRDPRVRIQSYQMTIAWLWICSAVAVDAFGLKDLYFIHVSPSEAPWLPSGDGVAAFGFGLGIALLAGAVLPALAARHSPAIRERFEKQVTHFGFFLPKSARERFWFAIVSISAGVCEEILFRGFLLRYFQSQPFRQSLVAALVLSCVFFGAAHLYQGLAGVVQTAFLGLAFGVLFLAAGTLLLPMVLHAAIDLKVLLILPKDRAAPAPGGDFDIR
jgi:uncharacterized protein